MILRILMIFFASFGIAFVTSSILTAYGVNKIISLILTFLVVRFIMGMLLSDNKEDQND